MPGTDRAGAGDRHISTTSEAVSGGSGLSPLGRGLGEGPRGVRGDSDLSLELTLQHFVLEFHTFCASLSGRGKVQSKLWGLCSWYKHHSGEGERQMLLSDWGGDHSPTWTAGWPRQGRALLSEMDVTLSTRNLCK